VIVVLVKVGGTSRLLRPQYSLSSSSEIQQSATKGSRRPKVRRICMDVCISRKCRRHNSYNSLFFGRYPWVFPPHCFHLRVVVIVNRQQC